MVLTSNPDTDSYLILFFRPRELIHFGMVSKQTRNLVRKSLIYLELLQLKFDKNLYPFDSYEIIKQYYKHNMICLISQHKFDHHRAVIYAVKYGNLDLLKLIFQTKSIHFPLAIHSLRNTDIIERALTLASARNYHHILKWFADVGIIDNWYMPQKVYDAAVGSSISFIVLQNFVRYISDRNDLSVLRYLEKTYDNFISNYWQDILEHAFEHGHFDTLNWLSNVVKTVLSQSEMVFNIELPYEPEEPTIIISLVKWFQDHQHQFPNHLKLRYHNICTHAQIDILEQIYAQMVEVDTNIFDGTIASCNLDALKWTYDKNSRYVKQHIGEIMARAVSYNYLHVADWLLSICGQILHDKSFRLNTISQGNILFLEWFHTNKIHINPHAQCLYQCANRGYIHVLAWLKSHQLLTRYEYTFIIRGTIIGGQSEILKWVDRTNLKKCVSINTDLFALAIQFCRIPILDLFVEYRLIKQELINCSAYLLYATPFIISPNSYLVISWWHKQGYPIDLLHILSCAIILDMWHIAEWILLHYPTINMTDLADDEHEKITKYLAYKHG